MNIEMLLKEFKNIRVHEERTKIFYEHYIDQLEDEKVKETLVSIRDDEIMHMRLADKLIEIVS